MKREWYFMGEVGPVGPFDSKTLAEDAVKLATDPVVSEAQRRAMWVAKEGHSTLGIPERVGAEFVGKDAEMSLAAGVLTVTPEGRVLLLKRADVGDGHPHAGCWQLPGGLGEEGEDAEACARREYKEELGRDCEGALKAVDARSTEAGRAYTTFATPVSERFVPVLDHESDGYGWFKLDALPSPLHPGLAETLKECLLMGRDAADMDQDDWGTMSRLFLTWLKEERREHANDLALDRAPENRYTDTQGFLHVRVNHISKANVCPYKGSEIPHAADLGLDPERIYQLYRDPKELEAGAETFNNLPLLSKHVPVTIDAPEKELIVGSTGTDAAWVAPYVDNSLVIWSREGLDGVESHEREELSCAYHYDADMTPGRTPSGERYDGVMRNIRGNHVALVPTGRAGPDVVVGDQALETEENIDMPKHNLYLHTVSSRAAVARGALLVGLRPFIAKDAQIKLAQVIRGAVPPGLSRETWKTAKPKIVVALDAALKGKLAKDADLEKVHGFIDSLDDPMAGKDDEDDVVDVEDKNLGVTRDAGPLERVKAFLEGKLPPEELAKLDALFADGTDAKDPDDKDDVPAEPNAKSEVDDNATDADEPKISKKAMDAAISTAAKAAEDRTIKRLNAMSEAKETVRPHVGQLTQAFDTAGDVYRFCLKQKGGHADADLEGISEKGLRAMVAMIPTEQPRPRVATDASPTAGFEERYGNRPARVA